MTIISDIFWTYYHGENELFDDSVGKWMYFFDCLRDASKVKALCKEAIEKDVVKQCKHTNLNTIEINPKVKNGKGVCCFYLDGNDLAQHKKVIRLFIENDMIPRTRNGRLYNISFKYDRQTEAGEYGSDYYGNIKLEQFVDLFTGEWVEKTVQQERQKELTALPETHENIAVLDLETNIHNETMSLGIVLAKTNTYEVIDKKYYIFEDEIKCGGMYSNMLYVQNISPIVVNRSSLDWLKDIDDLFEKNGISRIFAYNARFDYSHIRELEHYKWYDIMTIAANNNHNKAIPPEVEPYKNGRMKRGYGAENVYRYLSRQVGYHETHNALLDAIDELEIMKMLNVGIGQYEKTRINPIDSRVKKKFHVGDLVETKEDGLGKIESIEELAQIMMLEVSFPTGVKKVPGLLNYPTVLKPEKEISLPHPSVPSSINASTSPMNSKQIKNMINYNSKGRLRASNYKMMTGQITVTCTICGHQWISTYYDVATCPRCNCEKLEEE